MSPPQAIDETFKVNMIRQEEITPKKPDETPVIKQDNLQTAPAYNPNPPTNVGQPNSTELPNGNQQQTIKTPDTQQNNSVPQLNNPPPKPGQTQTHEKKEDDKDKKGMLKGLFHKKD